MVRLGHWIEAKMLNVALVMWFLNSYLSNSRNNATGQDAASFASDQYFFHYCQTKELKHRTPNAPFRLQFQTYLTIIIKQSTTQRKLSSERSLACCSVRKVRYIMLTFWQLSGHVSGVYSMPVLKPQLLISSLSKLFSSSFERTWVWWRIELA